MPTELLPRGAVASIALTFWAAAVVPVQAAGATTTRTKPFDRPPYYQGTPPGDGTRVIHLAPVVAAAPETPSAWLPAEALRDLAVEIGRFLEAESLSRPASAPVTQGRHVRPPTVYFGCELDDIGECDAAVRRNVLTTTGGTHPWKAWAAEILGNSGAEHLLVLELRLAPQWIHQKNLSGKKEVRLGTDHVQRLAWLTSLESPVWVLQLTGALVDAEGKAVRIGAEGIGAVRTPFRASILRAERLIVEDDVNAIRTGLARDDLPGRPLAWQAAARHLVRGLLTPPRR